jgi:hypothetical protein
MLFSCRLITSFTGIACELEVAGAKAWAAVRTNRAA